MLSYLLQIQNHWLYDYDCNSSLQSLTTWFICIIQSLALTLYLIQLHNHWLYYQPSIYQLLHDSYTSSSTQSLTILPTYIWITIWFTCYTIIDYMIHMLHNYWHYWHNSWHSNSSSNPEAGIGLHQSVQWSAWLPTTQSRYCCVWLEFVIRVRLIKVHVIKVLVIKVRVIKAHIIKFHVIKVHIILWLTDWYKYFHEQKCFNFCFFIERNLEIFTILFISQKERHYFKNKT